MDVFSIVLTLAGVVIGIIATIYVTKRYAHRPMCNVSLYKSDEIHNNRNTKLTFLYDGQQIPNLHIFNLAVELRGQKDLRVSMDVQKPSIHLKGFKILEFKTLNNNADNFDIPLAPDPNVQGKFYINVKWLRSGQVAKFLIFATKTNDDIGYIFTKGQISDVDFSVVGELANNI